jgi:Flp pilus assembly protein TadG
MRAFSYLRRFFSDTKGNIAILFGLAIIPVMGAMGAAVDYSLANASRTALQASLDNTGLMLAKMMPLSDAALNTKGWQIFQGNLGYSPLVFQQSDLVISQTTSTLKLDVNTNYNTQLASVLKLVGANTMFPVGAHTQVSWGNSRLRVALVLDNTGSMADAGKIDALKTATTNLINQLKSIVTTNGDVYISITPFVKDVNVGPSNYNAAWIDWTVWNAANGANQCSISGHSTQSSCTSAGTCSISQWTTKSKCQSHSGTWTPGVWSWVHNNHNTWNGCMMDRGVSGGPGTSADYDQNVTAPVAGVTASLFPAEQYSLCPAQQIIPLTYDWTALDNAVNGMSPNGSTNQPIGLVWGWQSLVGGGPFPAAPAMDPNFTYNQYVILLSDGLNTQDRWYGDGMNTSTQVDNRMYYSSGATVSGTCKNIKDSGIKIYTVQVDTGGDPTSVLMQNCASDPSMFFKLTSSSQIVSTFQQIGTALSNLHLSQ